MTKRCIKDMAASVRARLQTNAKETGRPFQEVLQYFAMERFLFRLSVSPYADRLILKGGLMLTAWRAPSTRPTKDIDLLAMMPNDVKSVVNVVKEICTQKTDTDGLVFDIASVEGRVIKEDAEYEGVRVTFLVHLQNARVNMQIDMGFGDVVIPGPVQLDYPTILDYDSPKITGYTREATVAEKFEAMVRLGQINSRIRDFFDIWLLSRQFDFEGPVLTRAVRETFARPSFTPGSSSLANSSWSKPKSCMSNPALPSCDSSIGRSSKSQRARSPVLLSARGPENPGEPTDLYSVARGEVA